MSDDKDSEKLHNQINNIAISSVKQRLLSNIGNNVTDELATGIATLVLIDLNKSIPKMLDNWEVKAPENEEEGDGISSILQPDDDKESKSDNLKKEDKDEGAGDTTE